MSERGMWAAAPGARGGPTYDIRGRAGKGGRGLSSLVPRCAARGPSKPSMTMYAGRSPVVRARHTLSGMPLGLKLGPLGSRPLGIGHLGAYPADEGPPGPVRFPATRF